MNDEQAWKQFERLADPELPAGERAALESEIEGDPKLLARYEAFLALSAWPQVEPALEGEAARARLFDELARDREEELVAVNLGKLFPVFLGSAVAAALVLGLLNILQFETLSGDMWEALFGLPAETIESTIVSQL
ncbi:hypothetical protein [Pelagicoccus sp. SDUM812005]|uniref:hypothetical protein n=1 Tax=Pelagicoccus sp. SDUM812005 TaxID=3041257 RepID=UPI00280D9859|nr:hypothetical protein [Pelagicoccus sp. SDUM812005]MDQ8181272.1 hypothetical protein [Pelagicoccus sp. SDUM812005]